MIINCLAKQLGFFILDKNFVYVDNNDKERRISFANDNFTVCGAFVFYVPKSGSVKRTSNERSQLERCNNKLQN